jgi:hypothetical protein
MMTGPAGEVAQATVGGARGPLAYPSPWGLVPAPHSAASGVGSGAGAVTR